MKKLMPFAAILLLTLLGAGAAPAAEIKTSETTANSDAILRAMQAEMTRSKAELKLADAPAPYFLAYRLIDIANWEAEAALGGLRNEGRTRIGFLLVEVRVGDYKQDSSMARGNGSFELTPLDGNEQALRFAIWAATDKAYKQALEALAAKQARLQQLTVDHPVDDFAHAAPLTSIEPRVELKLERKPWLQMLREATATYVSDARVQQLEARLNFQTINCYYVNSEGTLVRGGNEFDTLLLHGTTQADDAMKLERSRAFTARTLAELPSASTFKSAAESLVADLKQLREAPLADESYQGPVLLSADSSATVLGALVGQNVLGTRPELGQNARVRGAFASSYKMRVLPEFFHVVDDPSLTQLDGQTLFGHYTVDDEGVRAQRVELVNRGTLVNYLLGRAPIRDFAVSNGHGRASKPLGWATPAMGNLIVSATTSATPAELKQKLIALCRDRGLEYGYYAASMGGTQNPRLLYRVWVKDGHEELVRGAAFGDLDQRALRGSLVAAGNDRYIDNELQPVPYTVVAPSLLFDDLEVKRVTNDKETLPEYPSPEEASH